MIKIGHRIGEYRFDKEVHQKMTGFGSINFEIEITRVDNNNFFGKVRDDLTTGRTEGIGEIKGKVTGDVIEKDLWTKLRSQDTLFQNQQLHHWQQVFTGT